MILRKITILFLVIGGLMACNETPKNKISSEPIAPIAAKDASVSNETIITKDATKENDVIIMNDSTTAADKLYALKVEKMNMITANYNTMSTRAFKVYQSYIDAFGDNPGQYLSKDINGRGEMSDQALALLNNLDNAIKIPVLEGLNPFMEVYKSSGIAFSKAVNEADNYYTMQDYKGDAFKKGKGMHQPIIKAFEEFYTADSILRIHSHLALKEIDQEYIDRLKKGGFVVEYLTKKAITNAAYLMEYVETTDYDNLNANTLKELHLPIREAYDELRTLKEEDYDTFKIDIYMPFFYSSFESFVIASNELYLRVNEKRPFSFLHKKLFASGSELSASTVEGSPEKLRYKYKELVQRYNRFK